MSKFISFFIVSGHSKNEALVPKKQETADEIFTELNSKPTSAARRLVLLNGFVKIINSPMSKDELSAYSVDEILIRCVHFVFIIIIRSFESSYLNKKNKTILCVFFLFTQQFKDINGA